MNLAAQGFSVDAFGGGIGAAFPSTVGPFHYYDLHGALQQSLLDVTAIRNLKAEGKLRDASRLQAREEVVLAVTGVYLQLLADLALTQRQHTEVAYAEASYRQASAQADSGNKAPIEATRSLVEWQTERQRLRSQVGETAKREVQLARLIGLPLGTHIVPQERLDPFTGEPTSLTPPKSIAYPAVQIRNSVKKVTLHTEPFLRIVEALACQAASTSEHPARSCPLPLIQACPPEQICLKPGVLE